MTIELSGMLAFGISIIALLYTCWHNDRLRRDTLRATNLSAMLDIENRILQNPELLKFHGIEIDDLRKAGITLEEFTYLLASFTAGGIYHKGMSRGSDKPFDPVKSGAYRYWMCHSEKTRKAWPFLEKMMSESAYKSRIKATIEQGS